MYIEPPRSEDCVWYSGPPPHVGWWPASLVNDPTALRWWDGKKWSIAAMDQDTKKTAAAMAQHSSKWIQGDIQWTHPWW